MLHLSMSVSVVSVSAMSVSALSVSEMRVSALSVSALRIRYGFPAEKTDVFLYANTPNGGIKMKVQQSLNIFRSDEKLQKREKK